MKKSEIVVRWPSLGAAVALTVLTLFLVPTLACAGTESTGPSAATAPQGDLIGMLPASAINIGYFDYAALRNSPFFTSLEEDESLSFDGLDELESFVDKTGMDPRTDIHQVAFVTGQVGTDISNDGAFVAVATFDRSRVEDALAEFETSEYAGHTLWMVRNRDVEDALGEDADDETEPEMGDRTAGYLAILSDDTITAGSRSMVEQILDVQGGAASVRSSERLEGLIEDVDRDSELWFVSAQDRLIADLVPRGDGGPVPQIPVDRIRSLMFSASFSNGLALHLRGRTEAEADAKLLGDSLNGMLAFGKMMVQSNAPEIFAILDEGIDAGSSGRDVTVRARLSMEQIQQLRDYAARTFGDMSGDRVGG